MTENSFLNFNETLYNSVSDAWSFILGNNFHFGYFNSDKSTLNTATDSLINVLSDASSIKANSLILDVGCGIGEPAFYLHKKFGCQIIGISTSNHGIKLARQKSKDLGFTDKVTFQTANALDNELPSNHFDFVWQMESSHLIKDKKKLFLENNRVLNKNGILLLCDLVLKKELSLIDIKNFRDEFNILEKSFGKAKMVPLKSYSTVLKDSGFTDIETIDISNKVLPTPKHWKNNIFYNQPKIQKLITKDEINNFIQACDIIHAFFSKNILGYGIVKARKQGNL